MTLAEDPGKTRILSRSGLLRAPEPPRPPGPSPTGQGEGPSLRPNERMSHPHRLVVGGRARPLAEVACCLVRRSSGKSALEQSRGPAPARSGPLDCVPVAFPCQSRGNGRPDKAPCLRVAPWDTIDLEFLKVQLESAEDHFSTGGDSQLEPLAR